MWRVEAGGKMIDPHFEFSLRLQKATLKLPLASDHP